MKKIIYSILLAASFCACTKETINYQNPVPGENETGKNATLAVASRNTLFTSEDDNTASIAFKSLGGKVVLDVNTNTDWTYDISGESFIKGEKDEEANQLTLSCDQNKVEKVLSATVTIKAGDKTATVTATQNAYGTVEIVASENNFHLAAKGNLTESFEVTSTDQDWTFETSGCEWMLVTKDGNTINISAYPNEEYTDRDVKFILKAGVGDKAVTETIDVLQDRAAFVTSSVSTVPVTPFSSEAKEVEIKANFDWEYSVSGNESGWLTIERTENGLKFVPSINSGAETRTAKIFIKTGDGKENSDSKEITISQPGIDKDAFIVGLHVQKAKGKVVSSMLPVEGVADVTVDWGDGSEAKQFTTDNPIHEYADTGYFVVSVKGQASGLSVGSLTYDQKDQIEQVYNWGRLGLTSMESAFSGCGFLSSIPSDDTGAFSKVTTFESAFYQCSTLKVIPEGLLASAAETESVNNMFYSCKAIETIPRQLFFNCPKLSDAGSAFFYCESVEQIDKDLFSKNPELTDCSSTFSGMTKLTSVDKDLFANNPKITDLSAVFSYDAALTAIPAGIFRNQTECESFRMAFNSTGLTEIPAGLFASNTKCENFQQTFSGTKIKTVPADLFKGCKSVDTFMSCFSGCSELQSIPAELFKNSGS